MMPDRNPKANKKDTTNETLPAPRPPASSEANTTQPAPPTGRKRLLPASFRLPHVPLPYALTLVLIAVLGYWLRMRDALSSPIIGSADPYLHMARTWDLVQGQGVHDYPMGFMLLLSPLTLFGTDAFYTVARFLPPLLGVVSIVGVFFLCRSYTHPIGALSASLFIAVLPEHIRRTSVLTPTVFDLALLPLLLLGVLRAIEGMRWGLYLAGGCTLFIFFTHPWVVALLLPPVVVFFLLHTVRPETRRWAATMAGGSSAVFLIVLLILQGSNVFGLLFDHVLPQFGQLLASPGHLPPLPEFVDLPWMLTTPVLLLALVGAVFAVIRRTRLALLALLWSLFLLPLTLVDWLGMSFLPHRTVVYLSLGLVVLAALPITEIARMLESSKSSAGLPATFGLLGVALILTVPGALATEPWSREYDQNDFDAWHALQERDTKYLMAGSWQTRVGYRTVTANEAVYMPTFFQDERVRGLQVDAHPDLIVLVDKHTAEDGLPTDFLASWTLVGEWGDKQAYAPPS